MPETIQAGEENLMKVFSNEYRFEIPRFQRPYAWTTEEVSELLDDLLFAMNGNDQEPYFLGSVILIKRDDPKSQVVDGQQRLTTLTMLLCSLRELADEDFRSLIDEHIRQTANELSGAEEVVRVQLRHQDQSFFHRYVQSEGGIQSLIDSSPETKTDSQVRIVENVELLHRKLTELSLDERKRLAIFVVRQCYLVIVETTHETSAYRIFSVLNDRGLDLTATDILKAQIIGGLSDLSDNEKDAYSEKWEHIEQGLGRSKFNALFTHIRMIYGKSKQRRTLQEEFEQQVLNQHSGKEFINEILDRYADVYQRVLGLSEEQQRFGEYHGFLESLRLLDNSDWVPPAMAFFFCHTNASDRLSFTKDLERLAFGLFIRRANINHRINRYADILRDIEEDNDVFRDDGPLQLNADERDDIRQRLDGPIYTLPRVPRPLLLRLDRLLAEAGAVYNQSIISVEHVLPQNPQDGSQWLTWFPDAEEQSYWTHRLANLVLLSSYKNTRASNYEFNRKKTEYFQKEGVQTFALTSQVMSQDEWTPAVLEARQKELLSRLEIEWRLA